MKFRIVTKHTVETVYYVEAENETVACQVVKEDPDHHSVKSYDQISAGKERIISCEVSE